MKYFDGVHTLDELKKEYRRLAMLHHPDRGGDTATMQAINAEYDQLFPIYKLAYNQQAETPTHETAESTRSEFYTQNGWKGSRYEMGRSTKDIAAAIRAYVKKSYPDCKFSITTHYASMCSEISVSLVSGPYEALRDGKGRHDVNYFYVERDEILTDWARAVMIDVNDCIKSYRWSDCDSMIDYFDVNFYYSLGVGKWDKPYTISTKAKKIGSPKQPGNSGDSNGPIRVEINPDFNGIEVYFPGKPSDQVRGALKSSGWRWHNKKGCWYNKNTEDNLRGLRSITEPA